MQRIVYVTDSLMAGGTEQQLVELVTRLDRQRFTPTVICLYGGRAGRSQHFLPKLRACGVSVVVLDLDMNLRGKLRGVVELVRCIREIEPDMVQAVNYHSNLLTRLARPFLPRSLRLIGCVFVEYTRKQLFYERMSSWLCDVLVCNSAYLERQIQRVAWRQVAVIPNGIDVERFTGEGDSSMRCFIFPDARRVILFMGRIAYQKSPSMLVEALSLLKRMDALPGDVAVWIVGEGDDADEQQRLDDALEASDLRGVIVQLPATATPERLYAAADVLALPSRREGLPNVVLEALAAGRPAIVSEAANTAGVIEHGVNGWVFPTGDVQRLAEILLDVIDMTDEQLAGMRPACLQSAVPFSVQTMVESFEALYDRLSARS